MFSCPRYRPNSKVLDVGAGDGLIAQKMQKTFPSCKVTALEPNLDDPTAYDSCVKLLGKDNVDNLTLQEAIEYNPEKYLYAFDFVTVFKYNVPCGDNEEFIHSLIKVVKPNGTVVITSVEPERFYYNEGYDACYLTKVINKYFGETH